MATKKRATSTKKASPLPVKRLDAKQANRVKGGAVSKPRQKWE